MKSLRPAYSFLISAIALFCVVQLIPQKDTQNPSDRIKDAELKIIQLRDEMKLTLDKTINLKDQNDLRNFFTNPSSKKNGFSFYYLVKDSLKYWSDNEPVIDDSLLFILKNDEPVRLMNGDFLSYVVQQSDVKVIGLILIKHHYDYENKYLINNFNPVLELNNGFADADAGDTLFMPDHIPGYILKYEGAGINSENSFILIIYLMILILFLLSVYLFTLYFSKSFVKTAVLIFVVLVLRSIMLLFKIPTILYGYSIFSPSWFASSFYFNSLGDMLINASLLLVFAIVIYVRPFRKKKILIITWLVSLGVINYLIYGLVINSSISFEMGSPENLNIYSILAFTSIALLLMTFLFVTASLIKTFWNITINARRAWIGLSLITLYAAVVLKKMNEQKEHDTRKLIAQRAEIRQDHVAEYLFREQKDKIESDPKVREIANGEKANERLTAYISQKFFSGYLSKFELSVTSLDASDQMDSNYNLEYYKQLQSSAKATLSDHLFFINNESGGITYLALLPLMADSSQKHTLVLSLSTRFLRSQQGFPELFMSGRHENSPTDEYSIARYNGGSLVYEFGEYIYPLSAKDFTPGDSDFTFKKLNSYCHLIHRVNKNTLIVVSKPLGNFLGTLTLFSWMFIIIGGVAIIIFIFSGLVKERPSWHWNLSRKIQASVIFIVLLSFILVGSGTIYYIKKKYEDDQNKNISDQVNAIWFMVNDNILADGKNIVDDADMDEQFERLVSNTNIDFNIYSEKGNMVFSSQPKIFDKGIVSVRMNPVAFLKVKDEGLTQYIHPENAGLLKYIAAYAPFTNSEGNIIAFLNLPYFEKQNELNKEVSVFLSAMLNIYVLLFSLAIFITIFISSRITKPLLLIQGKMSGIRLGTSNEKIEYRAKDEIGRLVHEYNRMIDELSISAGKLARSERESAWREMAKQVAHEIKNPLTPMKLSVQHLLRTIKDKNEDVERIAQSLIQQIDTLSNIATAFSNFAQMPQSAPSKVELKELLTQVVGLYSEAVNLHLNADENYYFVMADKDQLVRVFSNLLKNAAQSVPPERPATIEVFLKKEGGRIVVRISDNGIGIPEDQRDKIFIPNFTTKSSGMGLGLAIVRKIVEEANGNVWFTSVYNEGSSFFVSLPEAS